MARSQLPDGERIERNALARLFEAATAELCDGLRLAWSTRHGALLGVAGALPASAIVINRVIGLGLERPATETDVSDLVDVYRTAGVARYFVQVHPEARPAGLRPWLQRAGLEQARGWQKFHRGVEAPPAISSHLECRRIGTEHGLAFARILCDAFDLGDMAQPWLARLPLAEGWHAFMSFAGDEPAGTGALYVEDGFGWLDFGATAPAFRQQGSQSALMATRIAHAVNLGCHTLMTCTGEDVPGDPQHSYSNILRAGFEPTYLRENFAPPQAARS